MTRSLRLLLPALLALSASLVAGKAYGVPPGWLAKPRTSLASSPDAYYVPQAGNALALTTNPSSPTWANFGGFTTFTAGVSAPDGSTTAFRVSTDTNSHGTYQISTAQYQTQPMVYSAWLRAAAPCNLDIADAGGVVPTSTIGVTSTWTLTQARVGTVNASLSHGPWFKPGASSGCTTFEVWRPSVSFGWVLSNPVSGVGTTIADLSGGGHDLTVTAPRWGLVGLGFNGTSSLVAGKPTKAASWTVINCSTEVCYGVDSAGGSYVNGAAAAGAQEWAVGTAGGYSGRLTFLGQWPRVLSAKEQSDTYKWIRRQIGTVTAGRLILDGDSLTVGPALWAGYPDQLALAYAAQGVSWDWRNVAVSGRRVDQMTTAAPTSVDPLLSPLMPRSVLVLWGGTNDMNTGTDDVTTYNRLAAYIAARRAAANSAGLRIYLVTIIARTLTGVGDSTFETWRLSYNAAIRANWAALGADGVIDIASDPHFDQPSDTLDSTCYNADRTHLLSACQAIVAQYVKAALDS